MAVELLTTGEVAALYGVVPQAVTRWDHFHVIRTPGGHRRYLAAEVRAHRYGTPLTEQEMAVLLAEAGLVGDQP